MRCLIAKRFAHGSLGEMLSWQVANPGSPLQMLNAPVPVITKPNQVLIKVKAASVNPIDTVMIDGYGNEMLTTWKQAAGCNLSLQRFPLIPGRDCAGVVEAVGGAVHNLAPGDEVMAVMPAIDQGCHAEFAVTDASACAALPEGLDYIQAASLPYTACTAWAALVSVARMNPTKKPVERVLIHGGSGGVGTMAIQMLKAWGVEKVVVTCSEDSFDLVRSLGAIPVDYSAADATDQLIALAPFEVVFDCVDSDLARWSDKVMGVWRNSVHVSIVSPMLRDTDRYGLLTGLASTAVKHFNRSFESSLRGRWFSYAFFMPNQQCLRQLSEFASEKKIKPIVEQVYPFADLPAAFEKVSRLNGRGKTVISFE